MFWQNICDKVDAITDADPEWVGPYFEADTKADDRIYTIKGGFLRELAHVDPLEVGIMPNIAAGADLDHLISLKMARDAMRDAGYLDRKFDSSRAGIVIGRGTYGNRGFASMLSRGFFLDQMMEVIHQLRPDFSAQDIRALHTDFKKQLPPYGGDMVGVLTPNAIAGLIANRLDLMGPSFIVDAACASTLIALDAATRELLGSDVLEASEDDWFDFFAAYAFNDHVTLTAAYADLGSIATLEDQRGLYLSLQLGF